MSETTTAPRNKLAAPFAMNENLWSTEYFIC